MPVNNKSDTLDNSISLASFVTYVDRRRPLLKREYDRSINRDLSQQNYQELMKRNFTSVLVQLYRDALQLLQQQQLAIETNADYQSLGDEYLKPFEGMIDELFQYVLQKHRSSCALSNFPVEHNPAVTYIAEVLHLAEHDFAGFKQQVGELLQSAGA